MLVYSSASQSESTNPIMIVAMVAIDIHCFVLRLCSDKSVSASKERFVPLSFCFTFFFFVDLWPSYSLVLKKMHTWKMYYNFTIYVEGEGMNNSNGETDRINWSILDILCRVKLEDLSGWYDRYLQQQVCSMSHILYVGSKCREMNRPSTFVWKESASGNTQDT